MKTAGQKQDLKGGWLKGFLAATAIVAFCAPLSSLAINTVESPSAPAPADSAPRALVAPRYSTGVAEVLKMTAAKIDPEVIKAYVRNSSTAYNPTVNEIIGMKDNGVSSEIITAMIQHGGEIRAQAPRAPQPAPAPYGTQPTYSTTAPAYAPAPVQVQPQAYAPEVVYPDYGYTYASYPASSVYYIGGGYGGYYPYWGWPSAYWGSGYCGYGGWNNCGWGYRGGWGYNCGYGYGNRYCNTGWGNRGYCYNGYNGYGYGNRGNYGGYNGGNRGPYTAYTGNRGYGGGTYNGGGYRGGFPSSPGGATVGGASRASFASGGGGGFRGSAVSFGGGSRGGGMGGGMGGVRGGGGGGRR